MQTKEAMDVVQKMAKINIKPLHKTIKNKSKSLKAPKDEKINTKRAKSSLGPRNNSKEHPVQLPIAAQLRPFSDVVSKTLSYNALDVPDQAPVPRLANGLDRVLFNGGGVYFLKDPRTNVYNFDHRLERIMSIADFDFTKIAPYVPAGRDSKLASLAADQKFRYVGSTSSMTGVLTQLHHALSHQRRPQILSLSKYFKGDVTTFTATQRAPTSFWLRESNSKQHDSGKKIYSMTQSASKDSEFLLTLLGHAMEVMLTTGCTEFQGYNKSAKNPVSLDMSSDSSTYNYTSCGKFLMRSQLDCYDPRLPGTGMFDLKTRACCAIRHDADYAQIHDGSDYQILKFHGQYESFEREYFELVRSALFKYSLQARIGRMDGIFVAYHSVRRLFGFEYLPLTEIDKVFHTSQLLANSDARKPHNGNGNGSNNNDAKKPEKESTENSKNLKNAELRDRDDVDNIGDLRQYDLESQLDIASHIADTEFKLSISLLGDILDDVRYSVLSDAQELHTGPPEEFPTDLNLIVHCSGPGTLTVAARAGLSEIHEDLLSSTDEYPVGMRIFCVDISQYIDGHKVERSQHPSLSNPSQTWRIRSSIHEYSHAECEQVYAALRASKVSQNLTSEPHTEEQPTQEIIDEMLKNLPEASALQQILRTFEQKGRAYSAWDSERPKKLV